MQLGLVRKGKMKLKGKDAEEIESNRFHVNSCKSSVLCVKFD
ncbi:hypothetical protein [Sulfuracidifex metallicus]|nr:hypothetical protein [Sulfuracidifex metallicus]